MTMTSDLILVGGHLPLLVMTPCSARPSGAEGREMTQLRYNNLLPSVTVPPGIEGRFGRCG